MNSHSPSPPRHGLTLDDVVERLSLTLGTEKGRELVTAAAAAAGTFDPSAVLRELQERPGLVGLTARRLLSQIERQGDQPTRPKAPRPAELRVAPTAPRVPAGGTRMGTQSIVDLFSSALGNQASTALVDMAKKKAAVEEEELAMADALRVLDILCAEPGLAGVTARFAKARLLLHSKAPA